MKFNRWSYIIFGFLIMICLGTVYSWSVFRPPVENYFNVGSTESGLPYMVSLLFYSLFMFLSGKYMDKYSPRLITIFGATLVSIGWILSSFSSNIYTLTFTYGCIIGAGVGIAYGAPMTVVTKWFPEKRGLAVGLVLVGFGLSPILTAPIARLLIDKFTLTTAFFILGITFLILIPLLALPLKYPESTDILNTGKFSDDSINLSPSEMIKSRSFKILYICFILGTMIGLTLIGLTSTIGIGLIKFTPTEIALLLSIFAILNGAGRPVFGIITDKLGSYKAATISFITILFASILMLFAKEGSTIIFTISFMIFWFNVGGWLAIAPSSTMSLFGTKNYSANYGIVFTAYGIGAVTGVLISGIIIDTFGSFYGVFYFTLAISIIGLCTSILLKNTSKYKS